LTVGPGERKSASRGSFGAALSVTKNRSPSGLMTGAGALGAQLGVAENLLHAWKKKFGSAAEQVRRERGGETAEEELKRLRREVTQLKQERDVLKKSVAVFAKDRS